jgi:hypothetical protein
MTARGVRKRRERYRTGCNTRDERRDKNEGREPTHIESAALIVKCLRRVLRGQHSSSHAYAP